MSFVLVLIMYGTQNFAIEHIPNFKTEISCLKAASEVNELARLHRMETKAICIKQ